MKVNGNVSCKKSCLLRLSSLENTGCSLQSAVGSLKLFFFPQDQKELTLFTDHSKALNSDFSQIYSQVHSHRPLAGSFLSTQSDAK